MDGGMNGWMSVAVVVPLALDTVMPEIAFRAVLNFSRTS